MGRKILQGSYMEYQNKLKVGDVVKILNEGTHAKVKSSSEGVYVVRRGDKEPLVLFRGEELEFTRKGKSVKNSK